MGLINVRHFVVTMRMDSAEGLIVDDVFLNETKELNIQLTDVVRVNALAVPAKRDLKYRVLRHELRMLLSFMHEKPGMPLRLREEEFSLSAGHVKRFVSESFGMGMLTAAIQSHFGWKPDSRSLENFDILPTQLAGDYPSHGVRPDLLFFFEEDGNPWRLAGEARGRSAKPPKGPNPTQAQRDRLNELVKWSWINNSHRITMTWAYTGSNPVQVDFFEIHPITKYNLDLALEKIIHYPQIQGRVPLAAIGQQAENRAATLTSQLYESAPEPLHMRPLYGSHVRGDWIPADLVAQTDVHLLLGVLDKPLPTEQIAAIRRRQRSSPDILDQDPVQISITQRLLVVIARGSVAPPSWSDVTDRLQ